VYSGVAQRVRAKSAQEGVGGERGTRTLDLGIMSAILPFFWAVSFRNLLISLDHAVQHFPLLSLVAAQKPAH
jgi:hypothetical protein